MDGSYADSAGERGRESEWVRIVKKKIKMKTQKKERTKPIEYGNGIGKTERYMSYGDATEFCRNWNKINYIECVYINCIHTYMHTCTTHRCIQRLETDSLIIIFFWACTAQCSLDSTRHKGLYFRFSQTYSPLHTNWILLVCMPFHMHVCARAHVYIHTLMCLCLCMCQSLCLYRKHLMYIYRNACMYIMSNARVLISRMSIMGGELPSNRFHFV